MRGRDEDVDEDEIDYEQEAIKQKQLEMEMKEPEEMKVGKKLSDLTTRRVIILVLSMMFSVPFLTLTTYKDENNSFSFGLELISTFTEGTAAFNTTFNSYVSEHTEIRTPVLSVKVGNKDWYSEGLDVETIRSSEYEIAGITDTTAKVGAIFDLRANTKLDAGLSIIRTIFICFVLAGGALVFSRDT